VSACYAVVPAAGIGSRFGAATPKQYLALAGRPVIEHTLARLAALPAVHTIVVCVSAGDRDFDAIRPAPGAAVVRAAGGAERCHSVLNGLEALAGVAADGDWALVHDAVRPCVRTDDVGRLIDALREHPVGGLLGYPVRDTMKRADAADDVVATVDRAGLWHALTPQMFRFALLRDALRDALAGGALVTDECQAVERAGHCPRMVEGHSDNIKITRRQDLALAETYLRAQVALDAGPTGAR